VGDTLQYLDGKWSVSNGTKTITGMVPGDLITDLFNGGLIGDPLFESNWLTPIWDKYTWNYTTTFTAQSGNTVYLVFDGIKMGAQIFLNNKLVGTARDQFLRYRFDVTAMIQASNTLMVYFPAGGQGIDCEGRFMACTGGWDWAPYSNTFDQHGANTLSKGIWKSVYLVTASTLAITHLVPQIFYQGNYPLTRLPDSPPGGFKVEVTAHVIATKPVTGNFKVEGSWGISTTSPVSVPAGESTFTTDLTANTVKLWWPNGLGAQNLYNVTITWVPSSGAALSTSRSVGFRVFTIVTANDSDPSTLQGKDGSGTLTMRFRINGVNMYSRGGNMIPMEEYEGRANADAFRYLVQSAADGGFNTFRIWGGGIFYYDAFYDACDELGIIMYHDMQYAQGGHAPATTPTQDAELRHQVRRLSHHPSIVIWDGCNECGGGGLYASFVVTTVAQEDKSRPIWPSCPANGWTSGVDMLWGLPNGKTLVTRSSLNPSFETHGPYQHGTGFKAVNDPSGDLVLFPANVPPKLNKVPTGLDIHGVYASEFGCVGMSSFESMSETLSSDHWSLHAPPMFQRNYPCDNIIDVYWGTQDLTPVGEAAFKKQLYQCLAGQALEMKSDIEARRSGNEFGTVTWQINEIWPTGGWGSIEYGTPVKGQVIGGRWKPLHYLLKRSLYTDVTSTCDSADPPNCYVKNDGTTAFSGKAIISILNFASGQINTVSTNSVALGPGAGAIVWICAKTDNSQCQPWSNILSVGNCGSASECMLIINVQTSSGTLVAQNEFALTTIQNMKLPPSTVTFTVSPTGTITLDATATAAYVTLTTEAHGRFSDNFFLMPPGKKTINFVPFGPLDYNTLSSTLRVEHARLYQ
jgi:hypothetical protein